MLFHDVRNFEPAYSNEVVFLHGLLIPDAQLNGHFGLNIVKNEGLVPLRILSLEDISLILLVVNLYETVRFHVAQCLCIMSEFGLKHLEVERKLFVYWLLLLLNIDFFLRELPEGGLRELRLLDLFLKHSLVSHFQLDSSS